MTPPHPERVSSAAALERSTGSGRTLLVVVPLAAGDIPSAEAILFGLCGVRSIRSARQTRSTLRFQCQERLEQLTVECRGQPIDVHQGQDGTVVVGLIDQVDCVTAPPATDSSVRSGWRVRSGRIVPPRYWYSHRPVPSCVTLAPARLAPLQLERSHSIPRRTPRGPCLVGQVHQDRPGARAQGDLRHDANGNHRHSRSHHKRIRSARSTSSVPLVQQLPCEWSVLSRALTKRILVRCGEVP